MAKITYIQSEGKSQTIDVSNGLSVMEGAVQNDISGIDADCGGGMACATCHVYVQDEWFDKLPTKEDGEEDMLDMAFDLVLGVIVTVGGRVGVPLLAPGV